jgi:hypothetical protein
MDEAPRKNYGWQKGVSGNPRGGYPPRDRVTPESLLRLADLIAADERMSAENRLAAVMPLIRNGVEMLRPRHVLESARRHRRKPAAGDRPADAAPQPSTTTTESPAP